MDRGLFYVPPDRREEGLVMIRSCLENIDASRDLAAALRARHVPRPRGGAKRRRTASPSASTCSRRRIDRAVDHLLRRQPAEGAARQDA